MGSHATIYAVVAFAIAAVSLAAGFFWGRSNAAAKVEQAIEKEHTSLDAREYAMRRQLEDAFAELARLRPLAEELGRVQERLKREQSKYDRMKTEFNAAISPNAVGSKTQEPEPDPAKPVDSADEAIQKLLQSLDAFNASNGEAAPTSEESTKRSQTPPQTIAATPTRVLENPVPAPVPAKAAVPTPSAPAQQQRPPRPAPPAPPKATQPAQPARSSAPQPAKPASPPSAKPAHASAPRPGQKLDEWQEFARQLEALTGRKK